MAKVTIIITDVESNDDNKQFTVAFDHEEYNAAQACESPAIMMLLAIQQMIRDAAAVQSVHNIGEAHKC